MDNQKWMDDLLPILIGGILLCVVFASVAHALGIRKDRAVMAVIGEAEGEPYIGKLAVACAIRERGTLKGVYGEHAPRVKKHLYSVKTFVAADRAWEESRNPGNCSFINGATGWGNREDVAKFEKTKWWKNVTVKINVGNHLFYR